MAPAPLPAAPRTPPPGEGVLCAAAIFGALDEVARRCFPDEDPKLHAALRDSVANLDGFILKNSKMTPADLAAFKREQSGVGAPKERLCLAGGEAVNLYQAMIPKVDPEKLAASTAQMVARPGELTFGDCL